MIYIKLSFNVDHPEISGSSCLKVTEENVKTFKCDFVKKMASSFMRYSIVWQLGAEGLCSQFQALFPDWPGNSPDLNFIENLCADEAHAVKGASYFYWRPEKNCIEGVEISHTILPQSLVQIDAGKNAGSDWPAGRPYQVLRTIWTRFCIILVNEWTDTHFDAKLISKAVRRFSMAFTRFLGNSILWGNFIAVN